MIVKTAWKNMFRYKKRTIITAFAIAAGVLFSIVMDGLLYGIDMESQQNLISHDTAAAKIYAKGYFKDRKTMPSQPLISKEMRQKTEKFLKAAEQKELSFTPRFVSSCEIYFMEDFFETSGSLQAVLHGVDPETDIKVFKTGTAVEAGRWLTKNAEADDGAVIGSWLAADMKAEVGYYITVQSRGKGGFYQTFDVPIVGIITTGDPVINSTAVYMSLDYLDDMLELDGEVSEYSIALGTLEKIPARFKNLSSLFAADADTAGLELFSWEDIASDILALAKSKSGMSKLMLMFVFIVAAVGISNTVLMAVMERKNEIAMLKALGYSNVYIRFLFMFEGVSIGIIGCAAGVIGGVLVNWPLVEYGIDFSAMMQGIDMGYRISGIMRSGWNTGAYASIVIGALAVSAVSAVLPAGAMLKKEIADIFRNS